MPDTNPAIETIKGMLIAGMPERELLASGWPRARAGQPPAARALFARWHLTSA
jgi:hypothetical protein